MKNFLQIVLLFIFVGIIQISAQVPNQISWQGVLTDAQGDALQGQNELIIRIFLSDDNINDLIPLWADTLDLDIEDGLVNVLLGENPNNSLNLSFEQGYWLEIVVNDGTPLSRIKMTSAPYSLMSRTVEDGAITTPKLANDAVTTPKIDDDAVTAAKIAAGAVRGSATGATAPSGQIEGASISGADIANNQVVRSIGNPAALRDNVNLVPGQNVTITNNFPGPQDIEIAALGQLKIEVNIDNSISIFIWNPQFNIFNLWIIIWPNGHIWWFHRLIIYETIIVCDPDSDGGVEINPLEGIILRNPAGEIVGRWNLDGTSEHMGEETFHGGIRIPLVGGGEILIDDQGITIFDDEGNVVTDFAPNGTSLHTGDETFHGDILKQNEDGSSVTVGDDGITIRNAESEVVGRWNTDGTSEHMGEETFHGGIKIPLVGGGEILIDDQGITIFDDEGNIVTDFAPDGTSLHTGKETYNGGMEIPLPGGGKIVIGDDGITVHDSEGDVVGGINPDGSLIGGGLGGSIEIPLTGGGKVVIDENGIRIFDAEDNIMTEFNPDGSSYHAGTETFAGGISIPLVGGGEIIIDSEGFTIFDADGLGVTSFFPDGTSTHLGTESFLGGIEVPTSQSLTGIGKIRIDENGITITDDNGNVLAELNSDGTSFHSGLETFASGIRVPLEGGGDAWFDGSGIRIYDDLGNEMLVIGEDGSIRKDTDTDGWIKIDETGITIYDDEGNVLTRFAPDGTSFHTGLETFTGGISVPSTNGSGDVEINNGAFALEIKDDNGNDRLRISRETDGTSLKIINDLGGLEFGPSGIVVSNTEAIVATVNYDGSSSYSGLATYKNGVTVLNDDGNKRFDFNNEGLFIYNDAGNCHNFQGPNGNSLQLGLAQFGAGLQVTNGNTQLKNTTISGDISATGTIQGNTMVCQGQLTVNNNTALGGNCSVDGNHTVTGDLNVLGEKNFRIDHPDDPYNKYLFHASIESDDVLNQYSGNVTTDGNGVAIVTLPDYVQKINIDFRYQLTVIGIFAQAIISKEISNNTFEIKTDKPNVKVSWQITAKRNDSVMKGKPFRAIREKTGDDRGKLLYNPSKFSKLGE